MRMSNETQTVVKILTGIISSVALLIAGVSVNNFVDNERNESKKLEEIMSFIKLYEHRMVKVESKVEQLDLNDREFEKVFSASFEKMTSARNQVEESDYFKKKLQ